MANYSYGGLLVRVTADTKPLAQQVATGATRAGDQAARTLSSRITSGLGKATRDLGKGIATGLGAGTVAAAAFGVQAFKAAARVGEMDAALKALAKSNHLSYTAMQAQVGAIRRQGIEAGVAQKTVAEFAKGGLDLAKSSKLARVAQDAAVISGRNSTEVLDDLIHGIVTQNTEVLRNAGLNVMASDAEKKFAQQRHKSVNDLTSQEKTQAVLNGVLAQGTTVAGAYAAAMEEPGKVLRSFPRLLNDIQVSVGQGLLKAFGPAIVSGYKFAKALDAAISPGGRLAPIFDQIGKSAARITAPLTHVIDLATHLLTTMSPSAVKPVIDTLAKFAPVFASIGVALSAFAGKSLLGDLPVVGKFLGGLGGPLGIVISGLATLALTSPAARKALGQLAATVAGAVVPIMAELTPIIGQLGLVLAHVLAAGLQAVIPLVPVLAVVLIAVLHVVTPLIPVITVLSNLLADMAPVLVPLIIAWQLYGAVTSAVAYATGLYTVAVEENIAAQIAARVASALQTVAIVALYAAQYVVRAATLAWTAAQWLLNAALDANPIGIVIVALAALGAALVIAWTKSATFRDIVIGAWRAVSNVIMGVIKFVIANARTFMTVLLAIFTGGLSLLVTSVVTHWSRISQIFVTGWRNLVGGATRAGGSIIEGLKSGITGAIAGIGGWIKKNLVDPIVNHVKAFFGIHSPSTVMEGIGGYLMKGLFIGMVPGVSGIGNLIGTVFGGFPAALATMISHGLVGIAGLPGKALNAVMSLFGGNAGALASTAKQFEGHRYVWGGGANTNTGFDCSSFVNMVSGMIGLGMPGGFKAPSSAHGPVTGDWLNFATMKRVGQAAMRLNDLYVSATHMGIVTGPGRGFAARSTATGTGPQAVGSGYDILRFPGGLKLPAWLQGVMGKIGGFFSRLFGGGGSSGGQQTPGGVSQWEPLVRRVLGMFGRVDLLPVFMMQMATESNGRQFAVNNWDSNAKAGTPSKGLFQVIQPTFDAFAGPFRSRGIFDAFANTYAAVAYALRRYGVNIARVLGHGHGYAKGGIISEPVTGFGAHTGNVYHIGERGPELVSPLTGPGPNLAGVGAAGTAIYVYPSAGMDERALAAMVSRELAWATAGGQS